MLWREVVPGSSSRLGLVDHRETYGRHILRAIVKQMRPEPSVVVDLGCGTGEDLEVLRRAFPNCRCYGVDFLPTRQAELTRVGIELFVLDLERDRIPLPDESVDLVIANQVLEHMKEVFWVHHEVFRCLRVGGHFFFGVPNVLSLHNRLLGLVGVHPTQFKLISAHVRPFSKGDVLLFYRTIAQRFASPRGFWGAQFYPFPRLLARPLARLFPSLAFSIFFLIRKTEVYRGEFLDWPDHAQLETNFFRGKESVG